MPTLPELTKGVKIYRAPKIKPPREDLRKRRIPDEREKSLKERERRIRRGLPVGPAGVKPKHRDEDDEKREEAPEDEEQDVTVKDLEEVEAEMEKAAALLNRKTGLIEDVPYERTDYFVDRTRQQLEVRRFMEANELTEEDIHELVKVARGQINKYLEKYSAPVALANALDYAIWAHKQGSYQAKINAQLYGFLLELLARETGHWQKDLLKVAAGKPRLEQFVAKKQDIQARIVKVKDELSSLKDSYSKKWLSLQAEDRALQEMDLRVSDEVLKITNPEGYQYELFKRQTAELLMQAGQSRGRMGYKVWPVSFEEGKPVLGMRIYKVLDGTTDKRIEVDTGRQIIKAHWRELLEDSGKSVKDVVGKVKSALRYYDLVSEDKVKLGKTSGPYVLVTADFKLHGKEPCANPVRRRQLRAELETVVSLLRTLLGGSSW